MSQATLRFVQLRRVGDPAAGDCTAGPMTIGPVLDFRDDWSAAVQEAVTAGNVERAQVLFAALLKAGDDLHEEVARLSLVLLRRAAVDARLTVGTLRAAISAWAEAHQMTPDGLRTAVMELTEWTVDMISIGRFLRKPRSAASSVLARLIGGIVLVRLARSDAEDACLVRTLVGAREVELPAPPSPVSRPDPDAERADRFAGLSLAADRLLTRARATGQPDPALADVQNGRFPDLDATVTAMARAATELGAPPTVTLLGLRKVFDVERDAARSEPAQSATVSYGPVTSTLPKNPVVESAYVPARVPVLSAQARVVGRGDLMIIRTTHLRYEPDEISHIENVLASEVRARTHVIDASTSETVTTSTQSISETTKELETTEQNSLDQALESAATQSNSTSLGVSVSGGLGPIQAGVDVNADLSTSTSTSMSSAVSYSKTMTERASEMLRTEAAERRTVTSTTRVTETNEHKFDNADGAVNIAGIYRWLNKVDQAQLYNYGERLLLEFVVPEPATTLVYFAEQGADQGAVPEPASWSLELDDLNENNYVDKAARWDVLGLEPPPEAEVFASQTFVDAAARPFDYSKNSTSKSQPEWGYSSQVGEVTVPTGYAASIAYVTVTWAMSAGEVSLEDGSTRTQDVQIAFGGQHILVSDSGSDSVVALHQVVAGPLPIGISADQRGGLTVVVRVRCERTDAAYDAWRLRTYEAIRTGYLAQQSAYDNDQRLRQARQTYRSDQPSAVNRRIEQQELKRACQTVLTGQEFDLFGSLTFPADDPPRINRIELTAEADYIQFCEDLFDWPNMVYVFYPYQWAGRERWATLQARTSSDPTYEAFLQAGAARVMVPVRAGYEHAVGQYLATSEIPRLSPRPWREGTNPYPPIDELLGDAVDRPGDEVAVDEPWEVVTPTSLIYLQEGTELDPP